MKTYKIGRVLFSFYIANLPLLWLLAIKHKSGTAPFQDSAYLAFASFGLICATCAIYWPIPHWVDFQQLKKPIQICKEALSVGGIALTLVAVGQLEPNANFFDDWLLRITYIINAVTLFYVDWISQLTILLADADADMRAKAALQVKTSMREARLRIIIPILWAIGATFVCAVVFKYDNTFPNHATVTALWFGIFALVPTLLRNTKANGSESNG